MDLKPKLDIYWCSYFWLSFWYIITNCVGKTTFIHFLATLWCCGSIIPVLARVPQIFSSWSSWGRGGSIVSTQEQEQDSEGINVILGRNWPISHCEGGHKDIKWVSGGCWLQSRVSGETSTSSSRSRVISTDVSVYLATASAQPRFRVIIWSSVHQTL